MADRFLDAAAQPRQRVDPEAPGFEVPQIVPVGVADRTVMLAETVGEEMQRAGGGDRRIELPERAGSRVARVRKRGVARLLSCAVERKEIAAAHVGLPPHLEDARRGAVQPVGYVVHGPQVAGDVLAHRAVPPRRAEDEAAVLVPERDRQAVDLGLGHNVDGRVLVEAEKAPDAGVELRHVLAVEHVAERQHGRRVG